MFSGVFKQDPFKRLLERRLWTKPKFAIQQTKQVSKNRGGKPTWNTGVLSNNSAVGRRNGNSLDVRLGVSDLMVGTDAIKPSLKLVSEACPFLGALSRSDDKTQHYPIISKHKNIRKKLGLPHLSKKNMDRHGTASGMPLCSQGSCHLGRASRKFLRNMEKTW